MILEITHVAMAFGIAKYRGPKPPESKQERAHNCTKCGHDFDDKTLEKRTQINIRVNTVEDNGKRVVVESPDNVIRCCRCYDRELYAAHKGHMSGLFGAVPYATPEAIEHGKALEAAARRTRQ